MGKEVAKSPLATRLEATGELNTSGVVSSSWTLAGAARKGISPPHRGSIPIPLRSGLREGPSPPGDDRHEGEPGDRRFAGATGCRGLPNRVDLLNSIEGVAFSEVWWGRLLPVGCDEGRFSLN
jgi:hypothetical protein